MQAIEYLPYVLIVLALLSGVLIAVLQDRLSSRQFFVAMYGSIVLVILFFWLYFFFLHDAYAGAGEILQIYGATGKQGDVLLIHNTGHTYMFRADRSFPPHRLDVLDPLTGNKLNRAVLGDISDAKVVAIDDDKIWYTSYRDKLHVRNYYTAEIVVSQKDSPVKEPALLSAIQDTLDGPGGAYVRLPADTNAARGPRAAAYNAGNPDWFFYSDDRKISKKTIYPQIPFVLNPLKSDPDVFQIIKLKLKNRAYVLTDTIINPRLAFRSAAFLRFALEGGIPVTSKETLKELYRPKLYTLGIHNPESVFITSTNFDANRQLRFSLSRVTLDGQVLWTINESDLGLTVEEYQKNQNDYQNGNVISAFGFYKNILVMGVDGRVISMDVNTGKVLWSVHY